MKIIRPFFKLALSIILVLRFTNFASADDYSSETAPLEKLSPIFQATNARPPAEIAPLLNRLAQVPLVRSHFNQKKYITALTRPLVSAGNFFFAKELGIAWSINSPYKEEFIISESGLVRKEPGGKTLLLNATEHPAIRGFTQVFLALFKSDMTQISSNFDFFSDLHEKPWTLGLSAKAIDVRQFIRGIVLSGNQVVERVLLIETNGDRTEIVFADATTEPKEITDQERAFFER